MSDPNPPAREPAIPRRGDTEVTLLTLGAESSEAIPNGDRDPLDHLAEEYADRCRRGESPSISEYEARFPDDGGRVRKLLGAVAMMEQLRRGSKQARFMPERIGEFRILRELGRGGMGVVYEAVQESLWRHVAVKAIHHTQFDAKRLQRFQREAQAVAQLHHTNIVPIFGVGEHDGLPYYAMQYIRGRGLDSLLDLWRKEGSPPNAERWRIAARFASQAAEALGYAHEQGVLHRDIKPANLLIDEHDAVWVTDFGLAKMVGHDELTASGDVIGTLRYLAPESLRGISEGRSDVYSLGLTLYEMLTLRPPFGDLTPSELLHRVSDGRPVRPRQLEPSIPRDLETIVLKATARDLKDRYPTAQALADDLRAFLDDRPIQARRANFVERTWRWSRRNRMTAALATLAACSISTAAIAGWTGYAIKKHALEAETVSREKLEGTVTELSLTWARLIDSLAPEAEGETDHDIPLTRELSQDGENTGPTRTFGDHLMDAGPGPEPGTDGPPPFPPEGFAGRPPTDGGAFSHGPPPGGPPSFALAGPYQDENRIKTLLDDIYTSYDDFAHNNEANVRVQSDAAWVYYKIGALNERLKRPDEAVRSFERTLAIFDDLSIREPGNPALFARFLQVCSTINPWQVKPSAVEAVADRLERMELTLGRLLTASPSNPDYQRARMELLAKLALVHYKRGSGEVQELFGQALGLADLLVQRSAEEAYPHSDRSDVHEAFALVLSDQGKLDQARDHLEAAVEDLEWVAADGLQSLSLAIRMESLVDDFERIGDQRRADEMQIRADQFDPRPPRLDRPKPGRPFGQFRPDDGPEFPNSPRE